MGMKAKYPPLKSWNDHFFVFVNVKAVYLSCLEDCANKIKDSLWLDCEIIYSPIKEGVKYNESQLPPIYVFKGEASFASLLLLEKGIVVLRLKFLE